MRKKAKILLISYLSVLIIALGLYAWAGQWGLRWYRRTADESASLAYEETTRSVEALAAVLDQSPYATDSEMCDRICCEACARAAAAESALATLPFSTWELEQLSAWLNTAQDYARSLCGQGEPFTRTQRQELRQMAGQADDFSQTLLELRGSLQDREVSMDSREKRLRNVEDETGPLLSQELLAYEESFSPAELRYDGKFGAAQEEQPGGTLSEADMRAAAADFAGVSVSELQELLSYEGEEGRRCYQVGQLQICVSPAGVENLSSSRLVYEENLDMAAARQAAEDYLQSHGFDGLRLQKEAQSACLALFSFVREQDGVLCPDCALRVTVALDDGSIQAFDASSYGPEPPAVSWPLDEEKAREALPEGLEQAEAQRCILRSPGGRTVPCYVFSATDDRGRRVEIAVSAQTGKQFRITVGA